jgi:hypothetical protein
MINHARTLLLNVGSGTYAPGVLGEEYIPTYTPIKLPPFLQLPHKILFGTNPDRVFLNYRAAELLRLLHQTELAEFLYALDPRVTYWPKATTEFFRPAEQVIAQKIFGLYTLKLNVIGKPTADNKIGRCFGDYTVKVSGAVGDELVTITEASTPEKIEVPLTWLQIQPNVLPLQAEETPRGLSAPVSLQSSLLRVQFADIYDEPPKILLENERKILRETYDNFPFELETGTDPAGPELLRRMSIEDDTLLALWRFTTYARPDSALTTCLPRLEFLGEPFYLELFGVSNVAQPYATFKNIWTDHPNSVYRFAAFLMAMIYRIEELRGQNG